ncbi:MAG: OPT family oligopeptide transporter, partial [Vicinamibacterales bacterium]
THLQPLAAGMDFAAHAEDIWRNQVRFIGAGTIGVSAIWTLVTLAKPVLGGLASTIASSRAAVTDDQRDRDLPASWIIGLTVACLLVSGWLSFTFAAATALAPDAGVLTAIAVPFVFLVGFLIAGVCGYMAGLIGASNSPISGIGILAIVISASVLSMAMQPAPDLRPVYVAFALFITSIVFACATISNDNLQDLKTGQLVGASPMKQQIALIVGVVAGASVIPPILNLLARAYGFAGAPNLDVVSQNPLPAPQATLISALAQGVIGGDLNWTMIGIGALVGVGLILLDAGLGAAKKLRLPPLAVGIGIYLPMSATFAVVVGSIVGHWYNGRAAATRDPGRSERLGTLVASGLIVGESLFGVLNAGLIVAFSSDAPIALVSAGFAPAALLGPVAFVGLVAWLYSWMLGRTRV